MVGEEIMEFRIKALELHHAEFKDAITSIDKSLQTLTQLEAHHAETRDGLQRAFEAIKEIKAEQKEINQDVEKRLRSIFDEMPTLKLIRGWVIGGVIGTLGIVGSAELFMVLR